MDEQLAIAQAYPWHANHGVCNAPGIFIGAKSQAYWLPLDGYVSGVYFLMRGGDIVYIGKSVDVVGRVLQHRRKRPRGPRFEHTSIFFIRAPREDLIRLESALIRKYMPVGNGRHRNGKPKGCTASAADDECMMEKYWHE